MSKSHYALYFDAGSLQAAAAKFYPRYEDNNKAAASQQAQAVGGQQAPADAIGQASSLLEIWQASYSMSGLLIRDVTAKRAREIAVMELSRKLVHGLHDRIKAAMKAHPAGISVDAVRYEVQFLIHTREEFEQAVRAEAKKLLENALS